MMPVVYYAAKVILCSGVLYGYYRLALYNKTFHQWNRFYLLASVVLSLVVPLLKIPVAPAYVPAPVNAFRLLHVSTVAVEDVMVSNQKPASTFTTEQYLLIAYCVISLLLLSVITATSIRIYNILRSHPKTKIAAIYFLNTNVAGTPFSFFHYIVWNQNIDLDTDTGRRIFQHELTHVQQGHSWDKIFLLLLLIPFWINPFFWVIRRELHALHEFAADKKAMAKQDVSVLAQMILNTAFPQQHLLFTNHLFQSTIKRRIAMFSKLQHPTVNYFSRMAALPLILIVIASFALQAKPFSATTVTNKAKQIVVVVDAGHGGDDGGAIAENLAEKNLALALSKKIKEQNRNNNIRIVLTREGDNKPDLKSRVQFALDNKADLFLSIHMAAAEAGKQENSLAGNSANGIQVIVPTKNPPYQHQSEVLGSMLVQQLSTVYKTQNDLVRAKNGVWVLDNNVCTAVLIECGYLTDKNDRDYIAQEKNQMLIADKILLAIEQYEALKN